MAGMYTEVEGTECPVCHENYTEPKILPCAHLLCRDCLVSWLETNREASCPLCRCSIVVLPDSKSPVTMFDEYAESLPTDHAMSAMVESAKIFNQKRVCVAHSDVDAVSLCVHCSAMLCENCADAHNKLPAMSLHKLENLATLTLKRLAASKPAPCFNHPEKISKLMCKTHDVLLCQQCVVSQHRACPEVTSLSELFENCRQSLTEMTAKLREAESAINQVLSKMEEIIATSENTISKTFKAINIVCDNIISLAEDCRSRLQRQVLEEDECMKSIVQERKAKLNAKREKVVAHMTLLQRMTEESHCSSLVAMESMLRSRIIELDLEMLLPIGTEPLNLSAMNFDENTLAAMKDNLENIGELVFTPVTIVEKDKWCFHVNHGKNIVLTDDRETAEIHCTDWGTVLSCEPLKVNKLYEMQVEMTGGSGMRIGVLTDDAEKITVPKFARLFQSAIGIGENTMCVNSDSFPSNYGQALNTIKVGSHVGVLIDSSFSLHLYMDGKDHGIAWRDVKQPCYAMINLGGACTKVTTLLLTRFL